MEWIEQFHQCVQFEVPMVLQSEPIHQRKYHHTDDRRYRSCAAQQLEHDVHDDENQREIDDAP